MESHGYDPTAMIDRHDAPVLRSNGTPSPEIDPYIAGLERISASSNYEIDREKRLVSVKFRKKVTVREIEKYAVSLRTDPRFEPDFSEIVDMSDVEELDLSADEFIRLADKVDPFACAAKRAFVVRDSVQRHAARMHKILRMPPKFSIFRSVEEAKQWLLATQSEDPSSPQNSK